MSPGFMQWWTPRAARIDAISLRERILLFVTTLACVGALANWAWLAPAQDAHRRLLDNLDRQEMELQKARADLAAVARPVATQAAVRGELAEVDARLASGRETLRGLSSPAATQGTPTTPLTQLLVHLLHRHDGLTLLHTNTMNAAASPAAARAGPVASLPDGVARRGVELTVTGPYAELVRYVGTLEQALPQVRWGTMWLRSEKGPPELTLQLYVVEARVP